MSNEFKTLTDYEYKVTKGFLCGEKVIKGIPGQVYYSGLSSISDCKRVCNNHAECVGFLYRAKDESCGHWSRGPLTLNEISDDFTCYQKIARGKRHAIFYVGINENVISEYILFPHIIFLSIGVVIQTR